MNLKVLHVSSGNLYGGVETIQVTLARCHEVFPRLQSDFALCFEGRLSRELTEIGVSVHKLSKVRTSKPLTIWRARRKLAAVLQSHRYDVVICHSVWPHAIFAPTIKAASLPLVLWLHHPPNPEHWLDRWALTTAPDMVLCNSDFTADVFRRTHAHIPNRTVYCPVFGPPAEDFGAERAAIRRELDTPEDATVIVQVSRMETLKGHARHLEALGRLTDLPNWVCWFVGGAQRQSEVRYQKELEALAERLGVASRVRFLGERDDVRRLLAASDIYCQPNVDPEGFGITFVEAMAARLPVITTSSGGALEVVDATCGDLVPKDDVDALAEALGRFVRDPELRARTGARGPARALELCEPLRQTSRLYEVLRQTIPPLRTTGTGA